MADEPAIVRQVRRAFAAHRPPPGPIVVAVSGGPDSVALLRALAGRRQFATARGCHLNHGLRGADSDADEAFVAELATTLRNRTADRGVPLARDVAADAAGENLEAVARRIRYDWLTSVAREVGAGWVATGHTADDQAETVLFQLLRGTGLDGLAGIAARRPLGGRTSNWCGRCSSATRADVLAYLQRLGQDYSSWMRRTRIHRGPAAAFGIDLLPLLGAGLQPPGGRGVGPARDTGSRLAARSSGRSRANCCEWRSGHGPVRCWFSIGAILAAAPRRRRRGIVSERLAARGLAAAGDGFSRVGSAAGAVPRRPNGDRPARPNSGPAARPRHPDRPDRWRR